MHNPELSLPMIEFPNIILLSVICLLLEKNMPTWAYKQLAAMLHSRFHVTEIIQYHKACSCIISQAKGRYDNHNS